MASKVASDLEVLDSKQSNLFKAFDELHSHASSIVVFSLQWKDVEKHFDVARKSLQTGLESLSEREKFVASREKEVEMREFQFESDFSQKRNDLTLCEKTIEELKSLIQENTEEVVAKQGHFAAIQAAIGKREGELIRLRGCHEDEEARFERVKNSVKRAEEKLLAMERRVKQKCQEAESKEKEVDLIQKNLKESKDEVDLNVRKLHATKKEFELKVKHLRDCCASINQVEKDIKLKEAKHSMIKNELETKEKRLEFVQRETELKEENFVSLKNSVDQCAKEFERKEREIEGLLKELEAKEKSCESRIQEAYLIENKIKACLKEVESRETNVESLQRLVEKHSLGLQTQERQFRERVSEFETRQKESSSSPKSTEAIRPALVKTEPLEQANTSMVPSPSRNQTVGADEGKNMQLILNLQLQKHDSVCNEAYDILLASSDPAKLVLDAMDGFYPSQSSGEGIEFDVRIVRRSCILLLEKLMQVAPPINSQVKDEARKLANDWIVKSNPSGPDYLEASGIVQLVNCYGLTMEVNLNDLCRLLDSVGRHGESSQLRQAHSKNHQALAVHNIEKAPENSLANLMASLSHEPLSDLHLKISMFLETLPDPAIHVLDYIESRFSQIWENRYLAVEFTFLRHCVCLFEQLFRMSPPIQPHVRNHAIKLAGQWNEKIQINSEIPWEIFAFLQFLHAYGLFFGFDNGRILKLLKIISLREDKLRICRALKFAETIPGFIQNLIQRKKPVDAVRLIYAFCLDNNDKFSPVSLLMKYVNEVKFSSNGKKLKGKTIEEKDKATGEEICALESVLKCVRDYAPTLNGVPVGQLMQRINILHGIKKQRRESLQNSQAKSEQEQKPHQEKQNHVLKKRGYDALHHQGEPHNGRSKFHRTSMAFEVPFNPSSVQCGYNGSNNMVLSNLDAPRRC